MRAHHSRDINAQSGAHIHIFQKIFKGVNYYISLIAIFR